MAEGISKGSRRATVRGWPAYNICRQQIGRRLMRLSFTLVLAVSLSVLLARAEVLPPAPSPTAAAQPAAHAETVLSFSQFKAAYGKHYLSLAEEAYRVQIYWQNLKRLRKHNANPQRSYSMGANSFLDVAPHEFKGLYAATYSSNNYSRTLAHALLHSHRLPLPRTHRPPHPRPRTASAREEDSSSDSDSGQPRQLLESGIKIKQLKSNGSEKWSEDSNSSQLLDQNLTIDWTMYSGSIRHQGLCGACYAFSTADTIAAANAIQRFGFFLPLSVQQIVDCSNNGLVFGCHGGFLEGAFTYVQIHGLTSDLAYPYTSSDTGEVSPCKFNSGPFRINSFRPIEEGSCQALANELQAAPVSAGISGLNLQLYKSGVFNDCDEMLDHAVVVVGYKSGVGWRIKNSWGRQWGEGGLGWIGEGNTCGICNMAVAVQL